MKDYKEMAESVLQKRDEYLEKRRLRVKKAVGIGSGIAVFCIMGLIFVNSRFFQVTSKYNEEGISTGSGTEDTMTYTAAVGAPTAEGAENAEDEKPIEEEAQCVEDSESGDNGESALYQKQIKITGQSGSRDAFTADFSGATVEEASEDQEVVLKDLAANFFTVGVGINGSTLDNQTLNLPEYMELCKAQFNSCTMTNLMKSCYILDQAGSKESLANGDGSPVLCFDSIDPTLQWCMENGMKMRGHTLVWHVQAPEWFFREGYDENKGYVKRNVMLQRMESYIAQMMEHVQDNYPGVVYCWDVVNEAVDPDNGDAESGFMCRMENDGAANPWYETIGSDYVEMAFTYARKYAAEDVKLFYNDFNTYMIPKRKAIYALCESLKEKGLIDGIGMQGYWGISYPSTSLIDTAIREYAKLDLEIHITELSIGVDEENEEQFAKQAKAYGNIFIMLHNADTAGGGPANITNVTFFGLKDHYRTGDTTNSRLFDADYQPKPSFDKIVEIMKACY